MSCSYSYFTATWILMEEESIILQSGPSHDLIASLAMCPTASDLCGDGENAVHSICEGTWRKSHSLPELEFFLFRAAGSPAVRRQELIAPLAPFEQQSLWDLLCSKGTSTHSTAKSKLIIKLHSADTDTSVSLNMCECVVCKREADGSFNWNCHHTRLASS